MLVAMFHSCPCSWCLGTARMLTSVFCLQFSNFDGSLTGFWSALGSLIVSAVPASFVDLNFVYFDPNLGFLEIVQVASGLECDATLVAFHPPSAPRHRGTAPGFDSALFGFDYPSVHTTSTHPNRKLFFLSISVQFLRVLSIRKSFYPPSTDLSPSLIPQVFIWSFNIFVPDFYYTSRKVRGHF